MGTIARADGGGAVEEWLGVIEVYGQAFRISKAHSGGGLGEGGAVWWTLVRAWCEDVSQT